MKKVVLFAAVLFLFNQLPAQELTVSPTFSHSSYNRFQNNVGYELGYNQFISKKSKFGLTFSHSFYPADYNYTIYIDADPATYYRNVKSNNQILTFSINYAFNILDGQKSNFFMGPKLSLNYFKFDESGTERLVNGTDSHEFHSKYWENSKIGVGLMLEYDRKIFSDNMALFFSTEPKLVFFSKRGLTGSSDPTWIGLINFNLGLKINLKK